MALSIALPCLPAKIKSKVRFQQWEVKTNTNDHRLSLPFRCFQSSRITHLHTNSHDDMNHTTPLKSTPVAILASLFPHGFSFQVPFPGSRHGLLHPDRWQQRPVLLPFRLWWRWLRARLHDWQGEQLVSFPSGSFLFVSFFKHRIAEVLFFFVVRNWSTKRMLKYLVLVKWLATFVFVIG